MLAFGDIPVPDGWEMETRVSVVEPVRTMSAAPGVKLDPSPRASMVFTRSRSDDPNPVFTRNLFVRDSLAAMPGLKHQGDGELETADGNRCAWVQVSFAVQGMPRLVQRHLFRLDDGTLTQVAITIDEGRVHELDALAETALAFRP